MGHGTRKFLTQGVTYHAINLRQKFARGNIDTWESHSGHNECSSYLLQDNKQPQTSWPTIITVLWGSGYGSPLLSSLGPLLEREVNGRSCRNCFHAGFFTHVSHSLVEKAQGLSSARTLVGMSTPGLPYAVAFRKSYFFQAG